MSVQPGNLEVTGETKIVMLPNMRSPYLEPTVGRIVHYQGFTQTEPLAAIITAVYEATDRVSLTVFLPVGAAQPRPSVPFSETPEPGHWNWPPRT